MANNMLKRTIVAAVLIAVLILILIFGGWVQCALFSLAAVLSVFELSRAYRSINHKVFAIPAYLVAASFFLIYKLDGIETLFILWLMAVLAVAAERVLNKNRATEDALIGFSLLVYPVALYGVLMLLAETGSHAHSRVALLCAFAMPLMGDTFAYFLGRLFGKRKLCPEISPNKTVAGAFGGLLGGLLGGALVYVLQCFYPAGLPLMPLMALGFLCGGAGQLGDLFASAIKRYAGVKDYGAIFPGHGGMTDRLDSVLFCAPIIYAVFTLWPK